MENHHSHQHVQAQLAGAVPVPGAPPLPLILANQIQGGDIMKQVGHFYDEEDKSDGGYGDDIHRCCL